VPVGIVWSEIECAGGISSEYGCGGPGIGCPVSEDLRSDSAGGSAKPICDADWEGRMDESSEGASPGLGRGLDTGVSLGECSGEAGASAETRRKWIGYRNSQWPFARISKVPNALKPSSPI